MKLFEEKNPWTTKTQKRKKKKNTSSWASNFWSFCWAPRPLPNNTHGQTSVGKFLLKPPVREEAKKTLAICEYGLHWFLYILHVDIHVRDVHVSTWLLKQKMINTKATKVFCNRRPLRSIIRIYLLCDLIICFHHLGACTRRANVIRFAKHIQSYIPQTPLNSRGIQRSDTWLVCQLVITCKVKHDSLGPGDDFPIPHMDPKLRFGAPTPNWHTPLYCSLAPVKSIESSSIARTCFYFSIYWLIHVLLHIYIHRTRRQKFRILTRLQWEESRSQTFILIVWYCMFDTTNKRTYSGKQV